MNENNKKAIEVKIKTFDRYKTKGDEEYLIIRCILQDESSKDVFCFPSKFPKERWGELCVEEDNWYTLIVEPSKQRPENNLLVDLMAMDEKRTELGFSSKTHQTDFTMNNNYNTNTKEITGTINKIHKKIDRNDREYLIISLEADEFGSQGEGIFVFSGRERWEKELEEGQKYIFTYKPGTNKPEMKVLVDAQRVVGNNDM